MNKKQYLNRIENNIYHQYYDDAILRCEERKYLSSLLDDLKIMRDKYSSINFCLKNSITKNEVLGIYFKSCMEILKEKHKLIMEKINAMKLEEI